MASSSTTPAALALIGSVYLGAWPGRKACEKMTREVRTRVGMIVEADVAFVAGQHQASILTAETARSALTRLDRHCAACRKCELGKPP